MNERFSATGAANTSTSAPATEPPAAQAASEPRAPVLTDEQIIVFANHAADRIPASNFEGRVVHAVRLALAAAPTATNHPTIQTVIADMNGEIEG